jgi:hypothetical protein
MNQSVYQAWIQIKDPIKSTETEIYWNNVVCSVFYDSIKNTKIYYQNSCGFKPLYPLVETNKTYTKVHGEDFNCSNPWFQEPKLSGIINSTDGEPISSCTFHRYFETENSTSLIKGEELTYQAGFYWWNTSESTETSAFGHTPELLSWIIVDGAACLQLFAATTLVFITTVYFV